MKWTAIPTAAVVVAIAVLLTGTVAAAQTSRVSVASDGTQGNGDSEASAVSANGRFVAFASRASNLVPNDGNRTHDVFLHDRGDSTRGERPRTSRVSNARDGTAGGSASIGTDISRDGRWVTFTSSASNLVAGDLIGIEDLFLHDTLAGDTVRLSRGFDGREANSSSRRPSISGNGRFVAFESFATNLDRADGTGASDIFVIDTLNGAINIVSVASDGTQGNGNSIKADISADGRYVAFESSATNLVAGDTNNFRDIFVHDRQTRRTTRVSVASDSTQANDISTDPQISSASTTTAEGPFVAFKSFATNLVPDVASPIGGIFVHDLATRNRQTTRVDVASDGSPADRVSFEPAISDDGRSIAFSSAARNLAPAGPIAIRQVFVHDRRTGQTTRVSSDAGGNEADSGAFLPAISGDGRVVAFASISANLVAGDTNLSFDVFVRVLTPGGCDERADCSDLPGAPANFSARVTGASVAFTWSAPAVGGPVETYVVSAGSAPSSNDVSLATGSAGTAFTVNAPPGRYFVRISGRNSTGTGPPSNEILVTVGGGGGCTVAPGPPTALTASTAGRLVSLSWAATAGCPASSYVLEAGSTSGASDAFNGDIGNVTALSATAGPGTYFVRVRGRNASGTSAPSNEVIVTVR